jgi:hypothetical protein
MEQTTAPTTTPGKACAAGSLCTVPHVKKKLLVST